MEELQAPKPGHFEDGKFYFFHHKIMKIQDHGVVGLVYMNSMSLRTPKSEFI
jgi:hypothetical protein